METRERKAILDLFRSGYWHEQLAVSGFSWKWFGIDIPMDYFGGHTRGDIDFILALTNENFARDKHKITFYPVIEIKTIEINAKNGIRSPQMGSGKINKIKNQLEKLVNFGCGSISLKEIYLIETGALENNALYKTLQKHLATKMGLLMTEGKIRNGIGYYPLGIEPVQHPLFGRGNTIHKFGSLRMVPHAESPPFSEFTQGLEKLFLNDGRRQKLNGFPLMIFCKNCRVISVGGFQPHRNATLVCTNCGEDLE